MPRNKQANQKVRDERRAQIRACALRLFSVKGLTATHISDIAAGCGISLGLMYHYYSCKEEIYIDLIRTAYARMNQAAGELERNAAPPAEKIQTALHALLAGLQENENAASYYMLLAQAAFAEAIPQAAKRIIRKENPVRYKVISRILQAGQKEGSIKKHSTDDMALLFWAAVSGLAIFKAIHGKKIKMPDSGILAEMFLCKEAVARS